MDVFQILQEAEERGEYEVVLDHRLVGELREHGIWNRIQVLKRSPPPELIIGERIMTSPVVTVGWNLRPMTDGCLLAVRSR